jgi:hypothetical protein
MSSSIEEVSSSLPIAIRSRGPGKLIAICEYVFCRIFIKDGAEESIRRDFSRVT